MFKEKLDCLRLSNKLQVLMFGLLSSAFTMSVNAMEGDPDSGAIKKILQTPLQNSLEIESPSKKIPAINPDDYEKIPSFNPIKPSSSISPADQTPESVVKALDWLLGDAEKILDATQKFSEGVFDIGELRAAEQTKEAVNEIKLYILGLRKENIKQRDDIEVLKGECAKKDKTIEKILVKINSLELDLRLLRSDNNKNLSVLQLLDEKDKQITALQAMLEESAKKQLSYEETIAKHEKVRKGLIENIKALEEQIQEFRIPKNPKDDKKPETTVWRNYNKKNEQPSKKK